MAGEWQSMEISDQNIELLNEELLERTIHWLMNNPPPALDIEGVSQHKNARFHMRYTSPIKGILIDHYVAFPLARSKGGRNIDDETHDLLELWDSHFKKNLGKTRKQLFDIFFAEHPHLRSPRLSTRKRLRKNTIRKIDKYRSEDAPKKKKATNI